jgi:hypothetical protein
MSCSRSLAKNGISVMLSISTTCSGIILAGMKSQKANRTYIRVPAKVGTENTWVAM